MCSGTSGLEGRTVVKGRKVGVVGLADGEQLWRKFTRKI